MSRVFIISNYAMFGHGLKSLLGETARLDIIGQEADIDRALEQINEIQPDVIIVDSDTPSPKSDSAVIRVLKENSGIRVIGLNLQNNALYIYDSWQCIVTGVEDLLNAIDYEPISAAGDRQH